MERAGGRERDGDREGGGGRERGGWGGGRDGGVIAEA